jgi:hypothetical protein
MSLGQLVTRGDLGPIRLVDPGLAELSFRTDRLLLASESFGGFVGVTALAFDDTFSAAFLSVAGGGLVGHLLEASPRYAGLFMPILQGAFDVSPNDVDPVYDPQHTHPLYQWMSMLIERGDPLSYAARLRERHIPIVLPAAWADESVPNRATEVLAAELGLSLTGIEGLSDGPSYVDPATLPVASQPLDLSQDSQSAVVVIDPATHGMLTRQRGTRTMEPNRVPFEPLAEPVEMDNPVVQVQTMLADFADTHFATRPTLKTP